ncbi:MAG: NAD(P)H-hydrate dehydratase [Gammaproteobacteria bacterium]
MATSIISSVYAVTNSLLTPAQVREMDRRAIEQLGIAGYELMCRAGAATLELACERFPEARSWVVLCGAGNNAGDGYVIARLARVRNIRIRLITVSDPDRLQGDAASAWADFQAAGGRAEPSSESTDFSDADLIIDALLGTGLDRPLTGAYLDAVAQANAAAAPTVAVDIPTGLSGISGQVLGAAIRASATVTFVGLKQGLYLGEGPGHCGIVTFSDLGIPPEAMADMRPNFRLFDQHSLRELLPPRPANAHKGLFGHVLIVGGNLGMGGAVRLAGAAALRAGAGLVTVATRPDNVAGVLAGRPEIMCAAVNGAADLQPLLERVSVVALGPGLGSDDWAQALFKATVACAQPLVIDADGLNLLADAPHRRDDWILTPHPGEAGRLLKQSTPEVQQDRPAALAALNNRYGGVSVLKGQGTLVGRDGDVAWLIDRGNPGMATAGMGDVLTGCLAGILAQVPTEPAEAAAAAAWVHAVAGDRAARQGERGLLADDVVSELRACLNP